MKPVNLNKVRKAKARAEKTARAHQNAAKFGRTKAQRTVEEMERSKALTQIDGHKRDDNLP